MAGSACGARDVSLGCAVLLNFGKFFDRFESAGLISGAGQRLYAFSQNFYVCWVTLLPWPDSPTAHRPAPAVRPPRSGQFCAASLRPRSSVAASASAFAYRSNRAIPGCRRFSGAPRDVSGKPILVRACEGPRGTESAGPFSVSTDVRATSVPGSGAGGLRRWSSAALHPSCPRPVPGRTRGVRMVPTSGRGAVHCNAVVCSGTWVSFASCWIDAGCAVVRPGLAYFCGFPPVGPGRPRSRPVLLGDQAAVPCSPVTFLERGPTAYGVIRTPHRSSEPRVVLRARPWLARTPGPTKRWVGGHAPYE
jgi:hypothetical protein